VRAAIPSLALAVCVVLQPVARAEPLRPDGKRLTLGFKSGPVILTPVKGPSGPSQRCSIRIKDRTGVQTIATLPSDGENGADEVPIVCLALRALGRLPAGPGTDRIGLVYLAFAGSVLRPDNSQIVARVIVRTSHNRRWRIDEAATDRLEAEGATTIPAMRRAMGNR
jgi:hypothetical protein